jgi:NTE family protein
MKKNRAEIHVQPAATPQKVKKPIGLALQGGGSWGAYTWGVLDVLLASRTISIAQFSGTSAGAINAAIVASALAKGSAAQARESLRAFWLRVADPALADLARKIWGPAERSLRQSFGAWLLSSGAVTPYNANPLGINPLRDAIEAHVDIDAIRSKSSPALFVTVTNVKTGLPRVIANDAMSIDALLASACVPELFQAVELDGERYWDGGYCGNPTLWPMIHSGLADDLIVVQLAPEFAEVPTDGLAIRRRVGEIIFNSSLVAEMQAITAMRAFAERNTDTSHLLALRMHRIGPPRDELHGQGSPSERSRAWLQLLHGEGRIASRRFLSAHGGDIGVRETLDVAKAYSDGHKPKMRVPVKEGPPEAAKRPQPANPESRLPKTTESGDRHKTGVVPAPDSSIRGQASAGTRRRSSKDTGFPLARD